MHEDRSPDHTNDTTARPAAATDTPKDATQKALEDTFPASDPPAIGGSTGPNDVPPARERAP